MLLWSNYSWSNGVWSSSFICGHNYSGHSLRRFQLLLTAYAVRREGNVFTRVCPSIHSSVCPQGDYPGQVQPGGGYPQWGVPLPGGFPCWGYPCWTGLPHLRYPPSDLAGWRGTPVRSSWGVIPAREGRYSCQGGTLARGYPTSGTPIRPGQLEGYPSQVQWGGYPCQGRGYPTSGTPCQTWPGRYPCQVQLGASLPGVPLLEGTPPRLTSLCQTWLGRYPCWGVPCLRYPPLRQTWLGGVPHFGKQMEYLKRRGQYASCVHAGGLSCFD